MSNWPMLQQGAEARSANRYLPAMVRVPANGDFDMPGLIRLAPSPDGPA